MALGVDGGHNAGGRALGGRRQWFKVQAALDDREWDFRIVDGIAGETGLAPEAVVRLLGEHRSELRQLLLRDGRIGYTLKSRPKTLREIFAEMQMFARQ